MNDSKRGQFLQDVSQGNCADLLSQRECVITRMNNVQPFQLQVEFGASMGPGITLKIRYVKKKIQYNSRLKALPVSTDFPSGSQGF